MAKTSAQKELQKHWAKQAREVQKKQNQQQPPDPATDEKAQGSAPAEKSENKKKRK
ncbi:MAG: hypothetical protein JOZ10_04765 [Acidobacteria bacterium]|nr:hypothetical protein [Acidobacteriota bacterium]